MKVQCGLFDAVQFYAWLLWVRVPFCDDEKVCLSEAFLRFTGLSGLYYQQNGPRRCAVQDG